MLGITKEGAEDAPAPTIEKKYIWIMLIGSIFMLSLVCLFIGLHTKALTKTSNLRELLDIQKTNYSDLTAQKSQLTKDVEALDSNNTKMNNSLNELNASYTKLAASYKSVIQELDSVNSEVSSKKTEMIIVGSISGLSVISDIVFGYLAYNAYQKLSSAQTSLSYVSSRYYYSSLFAISHFLRMKSLTERFSFNLIYNSSVSYDQTSLKRSLTSAANTFTVIRTTSDEVICVYLQQPYDGTSDYINDPSAFTFSFRRLGGTLIATQPALKWSKDKVVVFGASDEISLGTDLSGVAITGKGFSPETAESTPSDFYTANSGSFTIKNILVYQMIITAV